MQRFLSLDPLARLMPDFSPYNYVFSNPNIFIDPSGLSPSTTLPTVLVTASRIYRYTSWGSTMRGSFEHTLQKQNSEVKNPQSSSWFSVMQQSLDIIGMTDIPIISQGAELASAGMSLANGNYVGAGLSLAAMLPIAGAAAGTYKIGRYVVGKHKDVKKLSSRISPGRQSHHIIQNSKAKKLDSKYKYDENEAPAISLEGGSRWPGSPHDIANRTQYKSGKYASERRIGYRALRNAGLNIDEAKATIKYADSYFMGQLGVKMSTKMN